MLTTQLKKPPCRFDLFTRYKNDVPSKLPGGAREWCHRGDKFDKINPEKMLSFLLGIIKNHRQLYTVIVLRDNAKPLTDKDRVIVNISNGQIRKNILTEYGELIKNIPLPEFLSYEIRD